MGRRFAVAAAALAWAVLASSGVAGAESPAKTYRIGWLDNASSPSRSHAASAEFEQEMRDIGYAEGGNLRVEYRYGGGHPDRLARLAAELVRLRVDVIVTSGEPAVDAARRATATIPIVATGIAVDPVKAGLVASLGRPGGNVTGLTTLSEDLWQKRLALLKETAPRASRLAVFWNPANPGNAVCADEIRAAAPTMRLDLHYLDVPDDDALDRALADLDREPPDALVTCWDSVTLDHATRIANLALKLHVPTLAPIKEYVLAGGLLSFGASLPAQWRRAAHYVDRILKGAKPADLPMERPTLFELVVNLKTAKTLGLTLPATLVVLADDLIE
jgi:putative ABC transport system substrate-binding protein